MTILADLKKYAPNARLTLLTTAGAVIAGEVDDIDASRLVLSNSSVGNVQAERGYSGHKVTVYLEHVVAHWAD